MAKFLGSIGQAGADTFTTASIDTGITIDSKSGLSIVAVEAYWENAEAVAAADWELNVVVSTTSSSPLFYSADEIARVSWGMQNTAGVAVAIGYEPVKSLTLIEPRLTVQPIIYMGCLSTLTGQANTIRFRLYYEVVKLSEMELMRLLVGGA